MNQEYKQWKKIIANPWVIGITAVFSLISIWMIASVFSHIVSGAITMLVESLRSAKATGVTGTPAVASNESLSSLTGALSWHNAIFPSTRPIFMVLIPVFAIALWLLRLPKFLYQMRIAYKDINKGSMGTAAFATAEDVAKESIAVPLNDEEYEGNSGTPQLHIPADLVDNYKLTIAGSKVAQETRETASFDAAALRHMYRVSKHHPQNGYDLIDTNKTNAAVNAGTQAGKTQTFSYPAMDLIMRAEVKDSLVTTDVKGHMVKDTKAEFEKYGYDVKVFNLVSPEYSIGYNPLELIKDAYWAGDYETAQLLCNTLSYSLYHNPHAKEPIWERSAMSLVNALILAVCRVCYDNNTPERVTMYTVTVMLNELAGNPDDKGFTALDEFFLGLDADEPAKIQYGLVNFSQGITRSGIYTETMGKLNNYTFTSIARMTSKNDLHLADLADNTKKPIALFIVCPDYDDSNYIIASTMISQISYVLSKQATLAGLSSLPRRVKFLLEEVSNFPTIEGLSRYMNVGLERGLIYYLVFQSIAQLKDKYGDKGAEALLAACGNKYAILPDGKDDPSYYSSLLGKKTIIGTTRHGDPLSLDKSYGESEQARDLMTANELMLLREGEWVLIRSKQRRNLAGQSTVARPIFANYDDRTQMLFAYQYLSHRFNHPQTFGELNGGVKANHTNIDLSTLIVDRREFGLSDSPRENTSADKVERSKPQEYDVHKSTNETLHVKRDQSGSLVVDSREVVYEADRQAAKRLDSANEDGDYLGGQHAHSKPLEQPIEGQVYEDLRPIDEVLSETQQNFIQEQFDQYLNSEEANAFWNRENFGQMQSYIAGKQLAHPDLYAAVYRLLQLDALEERRT